jgi:hypothetical protein
MTNSSINQSLNQSINQWALFLEGVGVYDYSFVFSMRVSHVVLYMNFDSISCIYIERVVHLNHVVTIETSSASNISCTEKSNRNVETVCRSSFNK